MLHFRGPVLSRAILLLPAFAAGACRHERQPVESTPEPVAAPVAATAPEATWRLLGELPTGALAASLAWRPDPETAWVLEAGGGRVHRLGAPGPELALPSGIRLASVAWDEARGALLGLDTQRRQLIVSEGNEQKLETIRGKESLLDLAVAHPSARPSHAMVRDALEHPVEGNFPAGYRGTPMADGTLLRAAVTDTGPVLLWSEPGGTFRRLALTEISKASSLTVLGADGQGRAWLLATTGVVQPRILPPRHLVLIDGAGRVRDRVEAPPAWEGQEIPPGRPAAEARAAVDRAGNLLWVGPGPKTLQVWVHRASAGGPSQRAELTAPSAL